MIIIQEKETLNVPGITSLFISFNLNSINANEIKNAIKKLDGRRFDKNSKKWEVPLSHTKTLLETLSKYDDIKLMILEEKKHLLTEEPLGDFKLKPFDYQLDGIRYGLTHDKWLLMDAMGLGKTLQAVYLAQELYKRGKVKHCLVICGVNAVKYNWARKIKEYTDLDALILGEKTSRNNKKSFMSVKERVDILRAPIEQFFIITNIETLRNDDIVDAIQNGYNNINMIVVDEIHTCKSPTSKQSVNLLALTKAKYKVGLTGTLLDTPLDAYVPLFWIGADKSTFACFTEHYCKLIGEKHNIPIGFQNLSLLKYQIKESSLGRKNDDVDLPPITISYELLEMEEKQQVFYNNIVNGIKAENIAVKISKSNLLAKITRLKQASTTPTTIASEEIPSIKLDRVVELVNQITSQGDKVVLFTSFRDVVTNLEKRLKEYNPLIGVGDIPKETLDNNTVLFNTNDEYKVFIGTIQECGTGIELQSASYGVFVDTTWTYRDFIQACKRIHRTGSKKPVFINVLVTKDTVDEEVMNVVNYKKAIQDYILDSDVEELDDKSMDILRQYILDL